VNSSPFNTFGWLFLAGGLLLNATSSLVLVNDPPDADEQVASVPVVRIPFDSLNKNRSARAAFQVPFRWERMRAEWGDPIYVVMARGPEPRFQILPFERLRLNVTVSRSGQPLKLERATLTKDRAVGHALDDDLRPWAKRLLPSGIVLVTIGAVLVFLTRRPKGLHYT
jgi:hypothetical protein